MYFMFTMSKLWSWSSGSYGWSHPPGAPHLASWATGSPVISMMTCRLPWSGCPCHTVPTSFCMQDTARVGALCHNTCICQPMEPHAPSLVSSSRWHQSLWSLILFSILHCNHCASTLHVQPNMHSLMACLIICMVVTSLNISLVMPSSFSLWTAFLIIFQDPCTHTQLLLFEICPFISGQTHCFFLCHFWYCSASMMHLSCGLNLLLSTGNSTFVALHFPFPLV